MSINATLLNLYHVCKREMWLHANGIRMEHTSDAVAEGKLIGETSYPQRAGKYTEIEISGSKIDFYDAKNKVVHEVKKSDSMEDAHEWQVKYYIYLLEQNGIENVKGIIEYPKLRQIKNINFTDGDRNYLQQTIRQIELIIRNENCPARINSRICKKCSYYDFCYIEET